MSKRKPHNPLKRYQTQADAAVSGLCFGILPGADRVEVIAYRMATGKQQKVGHTVARALSECRFKFAILLSVESIESNGKSRTVTHYERLASAYKHSDLIDHLNIERSTLIDAETERGNKVVGAGWMTCPVPKLPDDEIERLMLYILTSESPD